MRRQAVEVEGRVVHDLLPFYVEPRVSQVRLAQLLHDRYLEPLELVVQPFDERIHALAVAALHLMVVVS